MKKLHLTIAFTLLFFFSITAQAQNTAAVKGLVSSSSGPLPFATILMNKVADSSFVKAGFSDTLGKFNIGHNIPGEYFILVKMIGYSDYSSPSFRLTSGSFDIGTFTLKDNNQLSGVEVTVTRPVIEVEPDKTVFNVEGTLNATGSNGFELLRKAPGVIIDNNNSIIVEGKSDVQIFINGKLSILAGDDLANYLKSLQASDIDKIEIITQPSSKYDAAGNGGILNIKLKKDKKLGTNGSLNLGYGYGINHRTNNSISLNHRNKRSNYYGTYSNNFGKRLNFIDLNRSQEGFLYQSETDNTNVINANNAKLGADWFVSKNSTVGVLLNGSLFNTGSTGVSQTNIIPLGSSNVQQILLANNINEGQNYQASANINYRFEDTLGHEFSVDADYGIYNREADNYQPNAYYDGQTNILQGENNYRMLTPTNINFLASKVDYSQKLFKGKVGIGAKYSEVETDNTFNFYDISSGEETLNENRSNKFLYTEKILAGYVNYAQKLSKKISIQAGLRAEQTTSRGELSTAQVGEDDIVDRQYLNFFPSAGLTYAPSYKHNWSLTYSRRITRPNYQTLNPFESQISELSFRRGNPFLLPQYGTNIKLGHMFKYRFSSSLSYSLTNNFYAQITDTADVSKSFIMTRNVANQQVINLGLSLPFDVTKWWSMFLNVNANNTAYTGTDDKFKAVELNIFSCYAQNSFRIGKKTKFEVSGWFSSPSIWGGTYLTKSMGALNTALEHKFLNDNLVARVSFNDIFFTSPWRADLQYGDININGTGGSESRQLIVNLNYSFGNKNVKRQRDRETGLEDEKKRSN